MRMVELLKQRQGAPLEVADQVLMIKGSGQGMLDDVTVAQVADFEAGFLTFVHEQYPELIEEINTKKILGSDGEPSLPKRLSAFKINSATKAQASGERKAWPTHANCLNGANQPPTRVRLRARWNWLLAPS